MSEIRWSRECCLFYLYVHCARKIVPLKIPQLNSSIAIRVALTLRAVATTTYKINTDENGYGRPNEHRRFVCTHHIISTRRTTDEHRKPHVLEVRTHMFTLLYIVYRTTHTFATNGPLKHSKEEIATLKIHARHRHGLR